MTKPALAIIVACMALAGCQDKSAPEQAQTKPAGSAAAVSYRHRIVVGPAFAVAHALGHAGSACIS